MHEPAKFFGKISKVNHWSVNSLFNLQERKDLYVNKLLIKIELINGIHQRTLWESFVEVELALLYKKKIRYFNHWKNMLTFDWTNVSELSHSPVCSVVCLFVEIDVMDQLREKQYDFNVSGFFSWHITINICLNNTFQYLFYLSWKQCYQLQYQEALSITLTY